MFLTTTAAIYNTAIFHISHVGVCNDLLWWQILPEKAQSPVLIATKYSSRVKLTEHGSIHGMEAVTGKQTILTWSVLMFSQARDKIHIETWLKQSEYLLWSVFGRDRRYIRNEASHWKEILWTRNNRKCTERTEDKPFHRNTNHSQFTGT